MLQHAELKAGHPQTVNDDDGVGGGHGLQATGYRQPAETIRIDFLHF
jgi:hypothetical protein